MQSKKITDNNKLIAVVYFCINYDTGISNKAFINNRVQKLKKSWIGCMDLKTEKYLRRHLEWMFFGPDSIKFVPGLTFNKKAILKIIRQTIKKCYKVLPLGPTKVFVFPTFYSFVRNKMFGVTGSSLWKNTIFLFINPTKGWENALREAICHEFNHSVVSQCYKRETLLDDLIFEGLAEHFREKVVNGSSAPWSKTIPLRETKKIFKRIRRMLNSKDYKVSRSLFFGDKKYPLWTGYSIGYQIIKSFLRNNKNLSWKEIIKFKPREILKKSRF